MIGRFKLYNALMYTRRCLNCTLSSRSQSLELLVKDRLSANRSCVFHQHPLRPLLFLQRGLRRSRDVGPRLVGRNQSISKSIHICDLIITYFQSNDILILSLSLLFLSNLQSLHPTRGYMISESSIFLPFFLLFFG